VGAVLTVLGFCEVDSLWGSSWVVSSKMSIVVTGVDRVSCVSLVGIW